MNIIDGKKVSNLIKDELKLLVDKNNITPGLGIILVGSRPDSKIYVNMKIKACKKIGIKNYDVYLNENVSEEMIIDEVVKMNNNHNIHGILIQLPLPKHINEQKVLSKVSLKKDVDGFHVQNIGNLALKRMNNCYAPCTPTGCIELLKKYNVKISGKHVVILGRSNIVGMPLSLLFLHNDATVTICHSKTNNLKDITNTADILVAACGKPNFITQDYIKNDVVILDIGINKIPYNNEKGYKIVGDINFNDVIDKVKLITPVPGGIGPMTISMLLKHTIDSCLNHKINSLMFSE
jgi:5,10-methylene-tetrahydrofolate dehydrogenase/methenyl tetrahydrofolate cyclohydrolase